ncbi:hypothetical protein MPSEU_000482400 [Mayamaea pseudoterrestris]|nr:hypothetical protein MPSEU_000482400 [Mayamaea pseudoterrestris]
MRALKAERVDTPSIYMFTDAAKPVYVRSSSNDELENSRICSLLSSLRSSVVHGRLKLGDIRSMRSGSLQLSFMAIDSLIMVAVIRVDGDDTMEYAMCLRLVLEYVYAQLLTTLTNQALTLISEEPTFDLHRLLGSADLSMGLFCVKNPFVQTGCFLTGGIEPFFPLSPHVREAASLILQDLNSKVAQNYVFAMIVSDTKLVVLVQPPQREHSVNNFDLQLFILFICRQPNLLSDDLWLPFCFPRFNAKGYLHCYTNCLDAKTKTVLVLVAQDPSLFLVARSDAATKVRPKLGLLTYDNESLLEIIDDQIQVGQVAHIMRRADVNWRRSKIDNSYADEDDDYEVILSQNEERAMALIQEITLATACSKAEQLLKDLVDAAVIFHFVFRLRVPAETKDGGYLIQSIATARPPQNSVPENLVWNNYRKLSLRLRLGSAAPATVFGDLDNVPAANRICEFPAMNVVESAPDLQGVCYAMEGMSTFLAMNGQGKEDFELYLTTATASKSSIKEVAAHAAKLARNIIMNQKEIFLCHPLTWSQAD